jgi:hypothetical protein
VPTPAAESTVPAEATEQPAPAAAPAPTPIAGGLTPARRATLAAVVARVLDGALDLGPGLDAAALVEARLLRAPAGTRADLVRVLDVFGSRAAACLTLGAARPFAELDAARQDRMLDRWARSRVPLQRTVFQALRRLTLAVWYGQPAVQTALGHRGPLHRRDPAVPWEGPAPGASTPSEPIARTEGADRVAPPVRSAALPVAGRAEPVPPGSARPPRATGGFAAVGVERGRITPGRLFVGDLRRTADVVVVGSGAGGAVAAARLAEAGLEVVVLEAGGLWTSDEFTEQDAEMAERLYAEQGLRATTDLSVAVLQGSTVGGAPRSTGWRCSDPTRRCAPSGRAASGCGRCATARSTPRSTRCGPTCARARCPTTRSRPTTGSCSTAPAPSAGACAPSTSTRAAACARASAARGAATTPSRARWSPTCRGRSRPARRCTPTPRRRR